MAMSETRSGLPKAFARRDLLLVKDPFPEQYAGIYFLFGGDEVVYVGQRQPTNWPGAQEEEMRSIKVAR